MIWRPFWLAEGAAEYFRKVGRSPDNKRVSEKDGYPLEDLVDIVPPPKYDDDAVPPDTIAAFRIQSQRFFRVDDCSKAAPDLRAYLKELGTPLRADAKLTTDLKSLQAGFDVYSETAIGFGSGKFDIKTCAPDFRRHVDSSRRLVARREENIRSGVSIREMRRPARPRAILARFSRSGGEPIRLLTRALQRCQMRLVQFHTGSIETKAPEDLQLQAAALEKTITLMPLFGRARAQLARVDTFTWQGRRGAETHRPCAGTRT